MTVTGKVQKFKMRETSIGELGLQAAARTPTAEPAEPTTPVTRHCASARAAPGVTASGGPVTRGSSAPAKSAISSCTCSGEVSRPSARCCATVASRVAAAICDRAWASAGLRVASRVSSKMARNRVGCLVAES